MATDITLKSPNGEVIYYPKTVSDLVYDNETGKTIKEEIDYLGRSKVFSEVTGTNEKNLQAAFIDAAIQIDDTLEDCYYAFGILGKETINLYAVDNNKKVRPEWGNYIKQINAYNIRNYPQFRIGNKLVCYSTQSLTKGDYYVTIDYELYNQLVQSTTYNLWGWKIDKECFQVNKDKTLNNHATTLENHATTLENHATTLENHATTLEDISEIKEDENKAVHQLKKDSVSNMNIAYSRSTFSGFRKSIGKVNSVFNFVQFPVICRSHNDSTTPITEFTILFYKIENGEWGDVVYKKTFTILPVKVGEVFDDILNLNEDVDLTSYDEVGIGYITNAYSSSYNSNLSYSMDGITAKGQYTTLYNSKTWYGVSDTTYFNNMYYKLYKDLEYQTKLPASAIEEIKNDVIEEIGSSTNAVDISLPNKIYAVVGDTLQLFFRGCIKAVNPYNYDILVTCNKGKKYPRYFEYTPTSTDIGTTSFKITVKDNNGNVLGSKQCELVTVSDTPATTSNKTVLCFGDSLTSGGVWCKSADDRLPSNILFKGSKTNGTTKYFGVGGWTWESYTTQGRAAVRFYVSDISSLSLNAVYTNNGVNYSIIEINVTNGTGNILCTTSNSSIKPTGTTLTKSSGNGDATVTFTSWVDDTQNPLWSDGNMTFVPYVTKYCDGNVDFVYTLLSWNGQSANRTDFTSVINQVTKFARTLHTEYPNAKLKIMGVQVPSVNGGMGANYGATGTSYADGYGMVVTALNQNKAYQDFCNLDEFKSYCEFVNVSSQFDTDYNMPYTMKKVNSRSEVTEMIGTNGVHPATAGYEQIGDVVYRNMMAQL